MITHGHPDHIAAMGQFQDRYNVSMNHRDLPMVQGFVERLGYRIDLEQIDDLREGAVFDLGDRTLKVYEVPGHSAGHVVLFDEANGILLASDAVGSNRPTITDSLWMQFAGMAPIDDYLSSLQVFRSKVAGKIQEIYGGHNDIPFVWRNLPGQPAAGRTAAGRPGRGGARTVPPPHRRVAGGRRRPPQRPQLGGDQCGEGQLPERAARENRNAEQPAAPGGTARARFHATSLYVHRGGGRSCQRIRDHPDRDVRATPEFDDQRRSPSFGRDTLGETERRRHRT